MDSEENDLAYYAVQGLNGSSSIPDSPSPNSSQGDKRSRSRSRSPSSTYQRTVPGRHVSMNHQTKKIKPHTEGSCFTEETRFAFSERLNNKSSRTRLMTQEKFESIIKYMREGLEGPVPEGFSKAERANYRRDRRNALHDFSLGEEDGKLYRKSQHGSLKVVPFNKVIDVIHEHHASSAHSGVNKTFAYLKDQYYGVTFADVNFLLERCTFCESTRRRPNRPRAPLEAKESSRPSEPEESNCTLEPEEFTHASEPKEFSRQPELTQVSRPLERVQIDIVDVRSDPLEDHQWTLHVKDLFTKLSMLYALQEKQSQEIAMHLRQFMRFYRPPESIQLYDCKEFRGDVEKLLESRGVKIIYVSSKALKLQGLIKQANWVVKRRMVMWKKQNPESDWERGLEFIERSINNSSCSGLPPRLTPHKLLLGQNRRIELESERLNMNLSMLEIDKIAMGT